MPLRSHLPPRPVLIGREADVAELIAAVLRHRLVTLVGVAGVGKTSLAVEVAHDVAASFPGARLRSPSARCPPRPTS